MLQFVASKIYRHELLLRPRLLVDRSNWKRTCAPDANINKAPDASICVPMHGSLEGLTKIQKNIFN
jgi:hypothetical protein